LQIAQTPEGKVKAAETQAAFEAKAAAKMTAAKSALVCSMIVFALHRD
jgi:hypothetical protein